MALIGRSKNETPRNSRVVATGKRIKGGAWIMESKLSAEERRSGKQTQTALPARNRRARTLH